MSLSSPERLEALERSGLLNRSEQHRFDVLCESAANLIGVPIAQLNVLDSREQISVGAYPDSDSGQRLSVGDTGCQHVVVAAEPVSIPNTLLHPIMCMSPVVTVMGLRSYLGVPVFHAEQPVGSFCVADYSVREWSHWEVVGLQSLARLAGLSVER